MSNNLFETIGNYEPDSLIAGIEVGQLKYGITLCSGQGTMPRGAVIMFDSESDSYKYAVVEEVSPANKYLILGSTVDTGIELDNVFIADAYATGLFNRSALIFANGMGITPEAEEVLRGKGIFIDVVLKQSGTIY